METTLNNFVSQHIGFTIFSFIVGLISIWGFVYTLKSNKRKTCDVTLVVSMQETRPSGTTTYIGSSVDSLLNNIEPSHVLFVFFLIGAAAKLTYFFEYILILLVLLLVCLCYIAFIIKRVSGSHNISLSNYLEYIFIILICMASIVTFIMPIYDLQTVHLTEIKAIDNIFYYIYLGFGLFLSVLAPVMAKKDFASSLTHSMNKAESLLITLFIAIVALLLTSGFIIHWVELFLSK